MVSKSKKYRGYVRANHAKFAEQYLRDNDIQREYTPIDVPYEIIRMRENGHSIEEIQLTLYYLGYNPSKQEIRNVLQGRVSQREYLRARNHRLYVTRKKLREQYPHANYQLAMEQTKGREIRGLIAYYTKDYEEIEKLQEGSPP